MPNFHHRPEMVPNFAGREKEIRWLRDIVLKRDNWFTPVVVQGLGGVGKSSLVQQFLATSRMTHTSSWLDLYSNPKPQQAIDEFVEQMFVNRDDQERGYRERVVVLDGAEHMSDAQIQESVGRIFNWKPVQGLIITSRRQLELERSERLDVEPLDLDSAKQYLQSTTDLDVDPLELERLVSAVNGFPLALQLLSGLIRSNSPQDISRLLAGNFYDLADVTAAPSSEIIVVAKPKLISTSEALVASLQKQPENVRNIAPREFENLLAELLTDMGWQVELTKATRDGGKDLLAYMDTELGRLLCLVEAKRYREDRKIGVDLVRTLYGTLCDYQANSAMMVTTSSFSRDAQEFQQRHQYQLALRDYSDIVRWITQYKSNCAVQ